MVVAAPVAAVQAGLSSDDVGRPLRLCRRRLTAERPYTLMRACTRLMKGMTCTCSHRREITRPLL